jgi:hypothetical protein
VELGVRPAPDPSKGGGALVEVVKDTKGIYTLKPAAPEKADAPPRNEPASSKPAVAEPADRP